VSKYSASNHPPKAQALCQAFDIDHELDFAKREAWRHHNGFWDEGEMAWAKKRMARNGGRAQPVQSLLVIY
jgi:hypothetical protein